MLLISCVASLANAAAVVAVVAIVLVVTGVEGTVKLSVPAAAVIVLGAVVTPVSDLRFTRAAAMVAACDASALCRLLANNPSLAASDMMKHMH